MVYGGTTYMGELAKLPRYMHFVVDLRKQKKAIEIDRAEVDQVEQLVVKAVMGKKCDDTHIIAIADVSGCRLVCTKDDKSMIHLKNKALYPNGGKLPKIYKGRKHKGLLNDGNIVTCRYAVC